jgi:hypothetical protein
MEHTHITDTGTDEVVLMIIPRTGLPGKVQLGVRSKIVPGRGVATELTAAQARELAERLLDFSESSLL